MGSSQEMRDNKKGLATILSIGTANPPNEMTQDEFLNFYFRVTNWGKDMSDLKEKFKRICKNTSIRKRHMLLTEEFLKSNPQICDENVTSFNTREDILIKEVPKLGLEASLKAINEWGQPKSKITHIIFCTTSGIAMPGCDYELLKLLDLSPSVQRFMLYQQGCYGGGTVLRLAKDIVENKRGARVLAVCSEFNTIGFRGPDNIEKPLLEAFDPLGVHVWNSIFYAVHPGGPAILDKLESQLGLTEHKLEASRHVLSEFGNMWSTTVIFVLDEIRKRSFKEGMLTTGQGLDYGVLLGIGPGITIETVVLRSFPINNN